MARLGPAAPGMARIGAGAVLGLALGLALGPGGARPPAAQERAALVAEGRRVFAAQNCLACHTLGAAGTPIGPDLREVGARYREADLARWLADPRAQEATRHMPPLVLTPAEREALAAYLASLR